MFVYQENQDSCSLDLGYTTLIELIEIILLNLIEIENQFHFKIHLIKLTEFREMKVLMLEQLFGNISYTQIN